MLRSRLSTCVLVTALVALSSLTEAAIHLEHISTIYVPYSYLSSPRYAIDSDSVEQVAFDAVERFAYVIGKKGEEVGGGRGQGKGRGIERSYRRSSGRERGGRGEGREGVVVVVVVVHVVVVIVKVVLVETQVVEVVVVVIK